MNHSYCSQEYVCPICKECLPLHEILINWNYKEEDEWVCDQSFSMLSKRYLDEKIASDLFDRNTMTVEEFFDYNNEDFLEKLHEEEDYYVG